MKEDDIKKLPCPILTGFMTLSAFIVEERSTPSELSEIMKQSYCTGSGCPIWRQTDNECDPQPGPPKGTSAVMPEPNCYPAGYCGLGGKP